MAKKKPHHVHGDADSTHGVDASDATDENVDGIDDETGQHIEPTGEPGSVNTPPPPVPDEGVEAGTIHSEAPIANPDDPAAPIKQPLRTDGPTLEEYVAKGYSAENYPPAGYAPVKRGPSAEGHLNVPHGSAAMPQGEGEYHPNEVLGETSGERQPVNTGAYLDEDTHDFGPGGGEAQCRRCGKTREQLALKIGQPLSQEELESAMDSPLHPPRIR